MNTRLCPIWEHGRPCPRSVAPRGQRELRDPRCRWCGYEVESEDTEGDTVIACTWPRETGWHDY